MGRLHFWETHVPKQNITQYGLCENCFFTQFRKVYGILVSAWESHVRVLTRRVPSECSRTLPKLLLRG